MNKQGPNGIEWTKLGYTWNVGAGCGHECEWIMPDGSVAQCYAKTTAESPALKPFYPHGFNHHYYHEHRLTEPLKVKQPAKIFLDSMSDLMESRVPAKHILSVLEVVKQASWHTFQLLTKNAPRLLEFEAHFPYNLWIGVSAPPSRMYGKELTFEQQKRFVTRQLEIFNRLRYHADLNGIKRVLWMSIEPLSFDIAPLLENAGLDWAVIGAASNGNKIYQPEAQWVTNAIAQLRKSNTAIFFKGNLRGNPAADPWLEEFPDEAPPVIERPQQLDFLS